MIFVTDAGGQCVYASKEWETLTGQNVSGALDRGWLSRVHPDDREIVIGTIETALRTASEFSMRYRLLTPDNTSRWIGAGGVPSFHMEDGRFIGYLGSTTELAGGAVDTITAYGNVERFAPPVPHPATMPSSTLDLIADHLIIAHSLMEGDDDAREALPDLRQALFKVGRVLSARLSVRNHSLN